MLTKEEVKILSDKKLFELQKEIDLKVNQELYKVQEILREKWVSTDGWLIPEDISPFPSKVSKGYNYKGFPYQVTDYPSKLEKESKFSFRIIVWYGNFFSANLMLSPDYINPFKNKLLAIRDSEFCLLLNQDLWDSDTSDKEKLTFTDENISNIRSYLDQNKPIRLFKQFDMKQFNEIADLLSKCFVDWLKK